MPEKKTVERAKEDLREGKQPSTAAGDWPKRRCGTPMQAASRTNGACRIAFSTSISESFSPPLEMMSSVLP